MPAPTARFREIPIATPVLSIDTPAERIGVVSGESVISTGVGNELDFGEVDVSGGAANSLVKTMLWDITADNGNTVVDTFLLWLSSIGFDQAGSVVKYQALSGADQAAPVNTENYVANAAIGSYTWANMPESEPGAQNAYPSDEGASMVLSTGSDDAIMWAEYVALAASETAGIYKGLDVGFEFQHSFKYFYS